MDYYQYIAQKNKFCEGEGYSKRIVVKGKKILHKNIVKNIKIKKIEK